MRVKARVCNYGMVELMCWWLGAAMTLFISGHRESERETSVGCLLRKKRMSG